MGRTASLTTGIGAIAIQSIVAGGAIWFWIVLASQCGITAIISAGIPIIAADRFTSLTEPVHTEVAGGTYTAIVTG